MILIFCLVSHLVIYCIVNCFLGLYLSSIRKVPFRKSFYKKCLLVNGVSVIGISCGVIVIFLFSEISAIDTSFIISLSGSTSVVIYLVMITNCIKSVKEYITGRPVTISYLRILFE